MPTQHISSSREKCINRSMGEPIPVSPLIANFYMEDLERKAISRAPADIRPRLWKRYVDDVLAVLPKNAISRFKEHLNAIDHTGSIKFTHEEMSDNHIPFLDADIHVRSDNTIKFKVYRKATHTNQYLSFQSHHHISHKLSVVRTLVDRAESVVTDPADKQAEMTVITEALQACGYPKWTIEATKKKVETSKERKQTSLTKEKNKGHVTLPYIRGLSERLRRLFKHHQIGTSYRPHNKISQFVIHPKDPIPIEEKCGVIYEVSCNNCNKTYIGETSRKLGTRIAEHRKDYQTSTPVGVTTRASHQWSAAQIHKSAITDHMVQQNHLPNWDNFKVLSQDTDNATRKIREAIWIRQKPNMNRDEGAYHLSHLYDDLLSPNKQRGGGGPKTPVSNTLAQTTPPTHSSTISYK